MALADVQAVRTSKQHPTRFRPSFPEFYASHRMTRHALYTRPYRVVVHGHSTKTFEKHRKRAGPPALCFSLMCKDRTLDLQGGTAEDVAVWSGALQVLVGRAKDAAAAAGGELDSEGLVMVGSKGNGHGNGNGGAHGIAAPSPRGTVIRPGQAQHFHNPAPVPEDYVPSSAPSSPQQPPQQQQQQQRQSPQQSPQKAASMAGPYGDSARSAAGLEYAPSESESELAPPPQPKRSGFGFGFGYGLVNVARRVMGCHLTQETRVQNALDDVASHIRQALAFGCRRPNSTSRQKRQPKR